MLLLFSSSLISTLGWTLLHSIWQAMIVFLCLRLLLHLFKQAPAATRYNLSVMALLSTGVWFFITLRQQWLIRASSLRIYETVSDIANHSALPQNQLPGSTFTATSFSWLQPENYFPYLVCLYITGLLFYSIRIAGEWRIVHKIRRHRFQAFDTAWEHHLQRIAHHLGITRSVKLYLSENVDVPLMIGFIKPVIYLPLAAVSNLSPEQIEAILLHELAHIRRQDYFVNFIQVIIETLLFFNPFVRWISRNIRDERENACDEIVIASTLPMEYAKALLTLEECRRRKHLLAMASVDNRPQLFHRIKRMMEMKTKKLNYTQRLLALFILILSMTSIAWLAPSEKSRATPEAIKTMSDSSAKSQIKMRIATQDNSIAEQNISLPDSIPPVKKSQATTITQEKKNDPIADKEAKGQREEQVKQQTRQLKESLVQLARAKAQMDSSLLNKKEWAKMRMEAQKAMLTAQKQLQEIQWEQVKNGFAQARRQMDSSFANINWNKLNINWDSIKNNIAFSFHQSDSSLRNINWNKIQRESREAMARARADMDKIRMEQRHNTMIVNAGHAVRTDALINKLQEDHLLKNKDQYKIKLDNKGFYINGEKQPADIYQTYRDMIGENTTLKIERKKGHSSTSVTIDN